MTRRDGDATIKITRMDQQNDKPKKYSFRAENGDEASPQPASSKHRNDRDNPHSASNSLPGSRASSRPGSRMASRTNSQESIIDLFDCMTLAYGRNGPEGKRFQLISPKPRLLPHRRWTWADKLRINSAIWRSWHIQFVKGKKPIGCHFDPRLPESRPTLQADAIQSGRGTIGSIQYNQSQVGSVVRDYRRWRLYHIDASKPAMSSAHAEPAENPEDSAIDLDMPHPPLSPMAARTLLNDDTLKDFSDTLFISKKKHFSVPHPKKIARHVYNADIIQPGLMQLEPDFDDDFMETLDSLQDALCKTPTKVDLRSLIEFPDGLISTDSMSAFSESLLLGTFTTVSEEMSDSNQDPIHVVAGGTPYPVAITPNLANVARNLSFPTSSSSSSGPMTSSPKLWGQAAYQMAATQSQAGGFSQQSSASGIVASVASFIQMPPIYEVAGSGAGAMAMQVDSVPRQLKSSVAPSLSSVFSTTITKQEPYSPPTTTSPQYMNPGVDINDAIDILAAQLQQHQQQQQEPQKQWRQQQHHQSSKLQASTPNWQYQNIAVSGSNTSWSNGSLDGRLQPITQSYPAQMSPDVVWPNSNLPQSLPSTRVNWSLAGGVSDPLTTTGGLPQGIMSMGGLSSSNAAFIQNAGGLPHGMIIDAMAPTDQPIIFGEAYSPRTNAITSPGHVTPGHVTPGHVTSSRITSGHSTPGHATPGHQTPGHWTPGHVTPGHVTPGHATPGHATPGHATPGHATPGHATPGHATPGHATPGHATPGHATPGHVTPGHVTPGHVTPGHVTPGHVTPGHVTPGHVTPGHVTPGHVTPGHATPGHATPGHATPGHVTPGHVTPGHVTPGHVTPGHVTPGHVTPGHVTPGHVTPGHVTPGHVTPGHVTPGHVTPGHVTPGHVTPGHVTPGPLTPQMDESMEFLEFPFPTSKSTSSTASSFKTKRERPHSRKNSNDLSPRVSQVAFADSASYACFIGKSEAKELGKPSSSEMCVSPLLPSSGHPSNVSSAASSPGSLTEGTEFELFDWILEPQSESFSTPQAKRRKTPDSSGEKETRRRYKHLQSEHKRRFNIQSGLDEIQRMVPALRNTSDTNKSSTATMLQKVHEHMVYLKEELKDLRNNTDKLKEQIQVLNTEIDLCQDELPDSGAPVNAQSDRQLHHMMDSYVSHKMKENWTFWIFSFIVRPLFETYMSAVSSSHISDFDQTVKDWTEEHCRLKPLRKLVTSALTKVSRETSILMDPAALQTQIQSIIAKDTDRRRHGKT